MTTKRNRRQQKLRQLRNRFYPRYFNPPGLPHNDHRFVGFPAKPGEDDRVGWCDNCQNCFYWVAPGGSRPDGTCPDFRHTLVRWEEYEVAIRLAGPGAGETMKAKRRDWEGGSGE